MTHEQCKDLFIESLYDELDAAQRRAFKEHIQECADCRKAYRSFEETFTTMSKRVHAVPSETYSSTIWERVERKIIQPASTTKQPANMFQFPSVKFAWSYGIAAIFLIAVGIYVGKTYFNNVQNPQAGGTQQPVVASATEPADSLDIKTQAYLEKSKVLLQGLINLDKEDRTSLDLSRAQHQSRELVRQASFLTAALDRPDQQQVRQLINDLQIILLQLANLEVKPGVPAIELIEKGADRKSILFKINLEELRTMAGKSSGKISNDTLNTNL